MVDNLSNPPNQSGCSLFSRQPPRRTYRGTSVQGWPSGDRLGAFAMYIVESFAHNFARNVFFRRYGLLSAVLLRLRHYLI